MKNIVFISKQNNSNLEFLFLFLGFSCFPEGDWLFNSSYGCRICQLLHKGSNVDSNS